MWDWGYYGVSSVSRSEIDILINCKGLGFQLLLSERASLMPYSLDWIGRVRQK